LRGVRGPAQCAALKLHLSVVGFNKGNQSMRAAIGPLCLFIGTTSITFNMKLDDSHEAIILKKDIKKSKRGDSDRVNLARDIANDTSKRIDKEMKKTQGKG
jgi:hypothetical protein